MKVLKVKLWNEIPVNFIGVAEYDGGLKQWYKEGKVHREGGPAIEYKSGEKFWCKEGILHRTDGHAVEYKSGYKEWWIENIFYERTKLNSLIETLIFIGKEKGKYNLDWLRFLSDEGIEEFPVIPGMEFDKEFIPLFDKIFGATSKL